MGHYGEAMTRTIQKLIALGALVLASGASADVSVSGPMTASATWRAADGPYVITGNVDVQASAVVSIEPGTQIYMGAAANLTVSGGSLKAQGTAASPIVVTSDKVRTGQPPVPGDWNRWVFTGSTASTLTFVTFQYGKGLEVRGATLNLNGVAVKDQQGAAITQDLAAQLRGAGNSASGNAVNAIVVPPGDITGTVRWGVTGIPYLVGSGLVSVGTAPSITGISPGTIQQGQTVTLSLTGSRLTGASSLTADGSGLTAQVLQGGSTSQVSFSVAADGAAVPGPRKLTLLTDAGDALFASGFLVTRQQPVLNSISPTSVTASVTPVALTLAGTGFLPTSNVFAGETQLPTTVASTTSLLATGTFSSPSIVQISVRTPDPDNAGNTFTSASLPFTVRTPSDKVDLTVSDLIPGAITSNSDGSYNVAMSFKLTNVGGLATPRGFTVGGYLSSNGQLDTNSRYLLGAYNQTAVLAAGESVTITTNMRTAPVFGANAEWPAVPAGSYTLHVKADAVGGPYYYTNGSTCLSGQCTVRGVSGANGDVTSAGLIAEESEANNAAGVPISF